MEVGKNYKLRLDFLFCCLSGFDKLTEKYINNAE